MYLRQSILAIGLCICIATIIIVVVCICVWLIMKQKHINEPVIESQTNSDPLCDQAFLFDEDDDVRTPQYEMDIFDTSLIPYNEFEYQ